MCDKFDQGDLLTWGRWRGCPRRMASRPAGDRRVDTAPGLHTYRRVWAGHFVQWDTTTGGACRHSHSFGHLSTTVSCEAGCVFCSPEPHTGLDTGGQCRGQSTASRPQRTDRSSRLSSNILGSPLHMSSSQSRATDWDRFSIAAKVWLCRVILISNMYWLYWE